MSTFFKIDHFSCGYPGKFVLNEINLEVKKGDFVGIIGPNGSGKTTLFKGISAELNPLSGKSILNGKAIHKMDLKSRAQHLAIVTQTIEAGAMTVEEYEIGRAHV